MAFSHPLRNSSGRCRPVSPQLAAEYSSSAAFLPCAVCYLSYDHLGSGRLVTDDSGQVISRHDYLPFGEEIPAGTAGRTSQFGTSDNITQRFTGKERDGESGLDYFGARYYGSALGRFTSPDDFKDSGITDPSTGKVIFTPGPLPYADIENPQSLNKYAYVLNNPLRYTDPTGHCAEDFCIVEGAAVTTGALYTGAAVAGALGFTATAAVLHDKGDAIISGAKSLVNSALGLITQASRSDSNNQEQQPNRKDGGS